MRAEGTKPEYWNVKFVHSGEKNIYSLFSIPNKFLSDAVISCCCLSQPVTLLIPSSLLKIIAASGAFNQPLSYMMPNREHLRVGLDDL